MYGLPGPFLYTPSHSSLPFNIHFLTVLVWGESLSDARVDFCKYTPFPKAQHAAPRSRAQIGAQPSHADSRVRILFFVSVAATLSSRASSGSELLFVFSLLPARVQGEGQDKITRGTEQKQSRNRPSGRDASLPIAATLNSRASSGSEFLFVFSLLPARVRGEGQDNKTRGTEQKQTIRQGRVVVRCSDTEF